MAIAATDTGTVAAIEDAWRDHDPEIPTRVRVAVLDGRVLLVGYALSDDERLEVVRSAWAPEAVREVINEVRLIEERPEIGRFDDEWLEMKCRAAILRARGVPAGDVVVRVLDGRAFVLGTVQDAATEALAKAALRSVPGLHGLTMHLQVGSASEDTADR